jgi:bacterioferritin-associated ferredoxin
MLVCHCNAVSDRTIREAVRAGACSADAVTAVCGAARGCGGCHELVQRIVEDEQGVRTPPPIQLRRRESSAEGAELRSEAASA